MHFVLSDPFLIGSDTFPFLDFHFGILVFLQFCIWGKINKIVKQIDRFLKISMKGDKINPFTNIQQSFFSIDASCCQQFLMRYAT